MDYRLEFDPEKPTEAIECDCCGQAVPVKSYQLDGYWGAGGQREQRWLCEICSCTNFSKAIRYPDQCSDPVLYQSIAGAFNILRSDMQKLLVADRATRGCD
jgi:hypothetical protein